MNNKVYSIKRAAMINAIGKYSKIILNILTEVVLARLLTPHDYGIVAIVTVFTTFFSIFADMGLGTAVVQRKNLTQCDFDNLYTFTVYAGIFLAGIFFVFSYGIAIFYRNHVYIKIGHLLSISLFFDTLNMIPNGIMNRNKMFEAIAIRTLVVYFLSVIVTIALAFLGARYYSLVLQAILVSFLTFLWNARTTKPKFQWKYDNTALKKVASYSGYQFAFNLLNYFSRNLDNLLAGKFIGSTQLGFYNKSYTLMQYPVSNLSGIITPVLHPILSDYQNKKELLYQKYMSVVKLLAAVGIWAEAVCIFAGPEIIHIMYGNKWNESVIIFQLLSISIATQMVNSSAGAAFQALGDTKSMFILGLINTSVTVSSILVGIFSGKTIFSLAFWVSLSFICNFIISYYVLIKYSFKKRFSGFIYEIFPYIIVGIVVFVSLYFYKFKIESNLISLFFKVMYVTIIYGISLIVSGQSREIVKIIFK